MEGTGGLRKLRWSRSGGGKSGGIRVIYYFYNESMPLYLLAVLGKNEKTVKRGKEPSRQGGQTAGGLLEKEK